MVSALIILLRIRYCFVDGYILVRCDIQNLMCCLFHFSLKSLNNLHHKRITKQTY